MSLPPKHDEKFRQMLERLTGYCMMHGRDRAKNPDAWGPQIREQHLALVTYVESRMAPSAHASPGESAEKESK